MIPWSSKLTKTVWKSSQSLQSSDKILIENITSQVTDFRDHLTYRGLIFLLKEGKLSKSMREKYIIIIKMSHLSLWKNADHFAEWSISYHHFSKKMRKHLKSIYGVQKNKNEFKWSEWYEMFLIISKNYWLVHWGYVFWQQIISSD